ncbi:TPA: hypothetical protein QEK98_002946 [Stenotrophomonas maltophilia]|nr:hypothetical protein [Stenotrophomonas maltophilia]
MTTDKPSYADLQQKVEFLEEELYLQRQSAGREFYEKFIDAAAGNGIEMLTEVGYEMAARIGDLECQRDELIRQVADLKLKVGGNQGDWLQQWQVISQLPRPSNN